MAVVIAGERSGAGKTTVTMAILATLRQHGLKIQSFKVGPDYIDPMFHGRITGRTCRNLDPVLTSEAYVQQCFAHHAQQADGALVEGVMGLFDGAAGDSDFASSAHIARLLNLPVILVIDCSRLSRSVAAIAHGFQSLDPRIHLAGLVLNRVGSDRHLTLLKEALEPLHLPILGVLRRRDDITLPDRHLGLVPTAELPQLDEFFDRLAGLGEQWFDWSRLLPLVQAATPADQLLSTQIAASASSEPSVHHNERVRGLSALHGDHRSTVQIAVAWDAAFSFYYADNLEMLEALGAELVYWSPLQDEQIPPGTQGLYFGGGFPEMFAAELATNQSAKDAVAKAIAAGIPTYAECGGLMYLCEQLVDFAEQSWPMIGVLPTTVHMEPKLTLGYRRAIAQHDTPLMTQHTQVNGHEFHRSEVRSRPDAPLYQLQHYASRHPQPPEGWATTPNLHASYLHLHWGATPQLPQRFIAQCLQVKQVI
jgi:cobyrinic acid a,c-diamide synthase